MTNVYNRAVAITPSDTVNFARSGEIDTCDAIYVGSGGAMTVVFENDDAIAFAGVPTGTILPLRAKRVNATSLGASSLVALYMR